MTGLPGYGEFDLPTNALPDLSNEEWAQDYEASQGWLLSFLRSRDPLVVLARTAVRLLTERESGTNPFGLQQSGAEIAQALVLMSPLPMLRVPTSPNSFSRFYPKLGRNIYAFTGKHRPPANDVQGFVSHRARVQTVYYRNLFTRADCERVVLSILRRVDATSDVALGYKLSDLFAAMLRVVDLTETNVEEYADRLRRILPDDCDRDTVEETIEYLCGRYPLAARTWCDRADKFSVAELRDAAFALSEIGYAGAFTLPREQIEREFAPEIVKAIYGLALAPGDLAARDPGYFYLNNPVWKQPYIALPDGALFAPLARLALSFPFAIVERLMEGYEALEVAYERARAEFLERDTADLLRTAMPSSSVYRGVVWTDPTDGKIYENDVVATLGNFIFLFEAKSGRLKDAARRGGALSLEKNFTTLFVEPGVQAWRLQDYLDKYKEKAQVVLKSDGSPVPLGLDKPKAVFKFSIALEHFVVLTSAKHFLKELNLVDNDTAWAPVLSIGELSMIARYLDTEILFAHYLTRRATIEDQIDFLGDEQDLLALYLTNGFWIDKEEVAGRRVIFHNADTAVRTGKVARSDRTTVDLEDVTMSPLWKRVVKEVYSDGQTNRHRFDIVATLLNQLPHALAEFERRIARWRRGVPHRGEDTMMTKFDIGSHRFLVAVHLAKRISGEVEWREIAHRIATSFAMFPGATDAVVFLALRNSKEATYDGLTFFRLGTAPRPDGGAPAAAEA